MADTLTPAAETGAALPQRGVSFGRLDPAVETAAAHPGEATGRWVWQPGTDTGVAHPTRGWSLQPLRQATHTLTAPRAQPVSVLALPTAAEVDLALPTTPVVSDAAWTEAIADQERVPVYELRADWSRTGNYDHPCSDLTELVEEVTVTRDLAGELPAEVGLVEGYSAAKLASTLSGTWPDTDTDPVDAFAPYKADAALYGLPVIGTPVEFYTGFNTREGPQTRRQFTGSVSRVNPSSSARDVQLDALDPANKLRAPISIAPVGMDELLLAKYGPHRYLSRFNSQWLIDHIFRANGVHASPPARADAVVSATMHGSPLPEVGFGYGPREYVRTGAPQTDTAWTREGHPFGMLAPHPLAPEMDGRWLCATPLTMRPGTGIGISAWMRIPTGLPRNTGIMSMGPAQEFHFVSVQMRTDGAPTLAVHLDGGAGPELVPDGWTPPAVPTWKFVGMHVAFRTGGQADFTVRMDGRTTRARLPCAVPSSTRWLPATSVDYGLPVPMTNVQWWSAPTEPADWVGESWIPEADLDPGLNEWTGIPQLVNEDSWQLLTEVVAAEFGAVGFNPDGRAWFRSRAHRRPPGDREIITARRTLADLTTTTDEASVRNTISASAAPQLVADWEWVFESTDVELFESAPGVSTYEVLLPKDCTLRDDFTVAKFYGTTQQVRTWLAEEQLGYRRMLCVYMVDYHDRTKRIPDEQVSIRCYTSSAATLTVQIINNSGTTVRFQTPEVRNTDGTVTAGEPIFKLPGRKLVAGAPSATLVADPGSVATYGARTYDLGGQSRWHQHPAAMRGIAGAVLGALGQPVPALESVEVPHDPRRNLYDDVQLTDEQGLGSVAGTVSGIATKYTSSGARDTLTVRPLAPPGTGLWDDPALGRVGQTLRFGP